MVTQAALILDAQAQLAHAAIQVAAAEPVPVLPAKVDASTPGHDETAYGLLRTLVFATADAASALAGDDLAGYQQELPALREALAAYLAGHPPASRAGLAAFTGKLDGGRRSGCRAPRLRALQHRRGGPGPRGAPASPGGYLDLSVPHEPGTGHRALALADAPTAQPLLRFRHVELRRRGQVGAPHDRPPHPVVPAPPLPGHQRLSRPVRLGPGRDQAGADRRHPRPLGESGHRLRRLAGALAPGGRGPDHLPALGLPAGPRRGQDGAGQLHVRLLLPHGHLRRHGRCLFRPHPGPGTAQFPGRPAARRA